MWVVHWHAASGQPTGCMQLPRHIYTVHYVTGNIYKNYIKMGPQNLNKPLYWNHAKIYIM